MTIFIYCKCLDVEQICNNLHDTKVALLKLSTINLYHSHGCVTKMQCNRIPKAGAGNMERRYGHIELI